VHTPRNSTVSAAIAVILTGALTVLGSAPTAHASTPTAPTAISKSDPSNDEDINEAMTTCADALAGIKGAQDVALLIHALRGKSREAIQDALTDLTPDVFQRVTGQGQCIWLTGKLWLQPAQAGGDLAPGEAPLDHPRPSDNGNSGDLTGGGDSASNVG
jgi:basic membrane lipoprotein Med (substrate-binding protein (PBP1-ABC) superfamily)